MLPANFSGIAPAGVDHPITRVQIRHRECTKFNRMLILTRTSHHARLP
jgi:hypothetical protein